MGGKEVGEEASQGITRRDLLRRGAVLGGAVVWTTPVVQTLGMGRAFAQEASPTGGKDVSYAVISWNCDGDVKKVKWDPSDGGLTLNGALPDCGNIGGSYADAIPAGLSVEINPSDPSCILVDVPDAAAFDCTSVSDVRAWVKAGSEQSAGSDVCTPTSLTLNANNQPACSGSS